MTTSVAVNESAPELLERVVIGGDLSKLQPTERLQYYREVCASIGLNPLTRPFEYLVLNGKMLLYARRDATDQLRRVHGVSVQIMAREQHGDVYAVVARATDKGGRTDESVGAVATGGLKGEALANALMKAETKAKRRVTLSICGLGLMDETEVETVPGAKIVQGEAVPVLPAAAPTPKAVVEGEPQQELRQGAAPLEEWLQAFTAPTTLKALQALWRGCTMPDLWETWSPEEQAQLTRAKDEAKQRLGDR
jgi:hypothetical protein